MHKKLRKNLVTFVVGQRHRAGHKDCFLGLSFSFLSSLFACRRRAAQSLFPFVGLAVNTTLTGALDLECCQTAAQQYKKRLSVIAASKSLAKT